MQREIWQMCPKLISCNVSLILWVPGLAKMGNGSIFLDNEMCTGSLEALGPLGSFKMIEKLVPEDLGSWSGVDPWPPYKLHRGPIGHIVVLYTMRTPHVLM